MKYQISTSWQQCGHCVEGYTEYENLEKVVSEYEERLRKGDNIKYLGLSLSYINSLDYREREKIKEKEHRELFEELEKQGLSENLRFSLGSIFIKK